MSKVIAVIPASGHSSRFASDKPKQYHQLLNKTILETTVTHLMVDSRISKIYIAVSPQDSLIATLNFTQANVEILYCGGVTRANTVCNALSLIDCNSDDYILVHDAARCLLHIEDLRDFITAVDGSVGGILAIKAIDTIKLGDSTQNVVQTLDREYVYQAQTPQMFRYDILYKAYNNADLAKVTDEASVIEKAGYPVLLVAAKHPNFKVTYPLDLVMAQAVLQYNIQESY